MTDHNIARGSKSPWTSPLILVPKPREKKKNMDRLQKDKFNHR